MKNYLIKLLLKINLLIIKLYVRNINFGANNMIKGFPLIRNKGIIIFGNSLKMNSNAFSNPIGGNTRVFINVLKNGELLIGDNVGISNCAITCSKKIVIEDNVFVGGNVKLYDTDFHSLKLEERIKDITPNNKAKEITIKRGAFIGAHSIILKGVTVGKNSIVGAGSVVSKDIPDFEIWAGNPAKFIKSILA